MPDIDVSWSRFVEEVLETPDHAASRAVRSVLALKDGSGEALVDGDGRLRDEERHRAGARGDGLPIYGIWSASQRVWRNWQEARFARADFHRYATKAKRVAPQPELDPIDDRAALRALTSLCLAVMAYVEDVARFPGRVESAVPQAERKRISGALDELRRRLDVMPAESPASQEASLAGVERSDRSSTPGEGQTLARRAV